MATPSPNNTDFTDQEQTPLTLFDTKEVVVEDDWILETMGMIGTQGEEVGPMRGMVANCVWQSLKYVAI